MKKISSYLLFISAITLIAVFVTMVQQSYQKLMDTQSKISTDIILKPINPKLDISVLDDISKRTEYFENSTPSSALVSSSSSILSLP